MPKASIEEIELHDLILAKDDRSFAMLCDKYLEEVISSLQLFNRKIHLKDSVLIPQVVIDSFYSYFNNPEKYNPSKQSLVKFLIMDAEGDLKNAMAKEKRITSKLLTPEIIEETGYDLVTPEFQLINQEADNILQLKLLAILENKIDVEIANLVLTKERETSAYAEVLKISHLDFPEQQREVKRHKDRIKKVLARKFKGKHY